jgi:hypothetical protein
MKVTNRMQLCRVIHCSLTSLYVSSDIFTHHQEHPNCMYSFWYYSHVSLPAYQPATIHDINIRSCTYILDAPDDERKYRSKHLEQSKNNTLCYTVDQPATTRDINTRSCTYILYAPDDERKYRSKHVEQSRNNKLSYTVASCWSFS